MVTPARQGYVNGNAPSLRSRKPHRVRLPEVHYCRQYGTDAQRTPMGGYLNDIGADVG